MRNKIITSSISVITLLGLLVPSTQVYAGAVTASETCNVTVRFTATVPDSIEQGKSFTVSNITVSPSNSYGFNVVSSVFDMTATNTSSTTYSQNFYATNPSPTSGHNTYAALYPNWALDANGPAGGAVTIKLKKSVTVIQGYSGSPVTCNFTKTLATIPITAPAPTPTPSASPSSTPSPSSSAHPSSQPSPSNSSTITTTSSGSTSTTSATIQTDSTGSQTAASTDITKAAAANGASSSPDSGITVVPLNIAVKDSNGKIITGATVTLDDTKKLTTDNAGRVTFSNVLTGNHTLLVLYKGQQTTSTIQLKTSDTGKIFQISIKPISQSSEFPIVAASTTAVAAVGVSAAGFVIMRKRKLAEALKNQPTPSLTLPGIISGSAVAPPSSQPTTHIPAIPMFNTRPIAQSPAPWEPAVALVTPPVALAPATTAVTEPLGSHIVTQQTDATTVSSAAEQPVGTAVQESAVDAPPDIRPTAPPLPTISRF